MKRFYLVLFLWIGCRGWVSEKPPIHLNPNMDTQLKYKPYRESDFFEDKRTMRTPVENTIARGQLEEDEIFYQGKENGKLVNYFPKQIKLHEDNLKRGQERFNIYCAPCHGQTGAGNGLVGKRMVVKPTNLHSPYLYEQPIGHFYKVIGEGIRTMQGYKHQISPEDRWFIVGYILALQELGKNTEERRSHE